MNSMLACLIFWLRLPRCLVWTARLRPVLQPCVFVALVSVSTCLLAGCDHDCVFPSGRVCRDGSHCSSDDLCNSLKCEDGRFVSSTEAICVAPPGAGSPECKQRTGDCAPTGKDQVCTGDAGPERHHWYCPSNSTNDCPGAGCLYWGQFSNEPGTLWCCP
jgi:hypothetical protein